MALFKAVMPATLLTWIVCLFIGSAGSGGGFLHIQPLLLADHRIFWSWPLFLAGTLLSWFIYTMLE
ncbi:hypothetical protein EYB45_10055 [Erythrobacteraceae bacterium CFH 75059]|nr:hypothetical protein EYB45_10055 [Erythrobacteraceae bacterium CFH 75059]